MFARGKTFWMKRTNSFYLSLQKEGKHNFTFLLPVTVLLGFDKRIDDTVKIFWSHSSWLIKPSCSVLELLRLK